MALKLLISLGLVAAASCRMWGPSSMYHRHGMRVGSSEISIEVPPPEKRDPEKCELFENVDYMEQGCGQHCSVNGYFGGIRIQDAHSRRLSTCKPADSYCRVPIITHADMNVTYTNGRCNSDCQCEPYKQEEEVVRGIRHLVGSLITSRHHSHRSHHHLHSGQNQFGVIKLRIPSPSERNETACEDYESSYYSMGHRQEDFQCKDVCTLHGNIGGLQFEGAPRIMNGNKSDGSYCELHTDGEGKIDLKGVQQVVQGHCQKGVCRPLGWKEPEEVKPLLTLTPTLKTKVQLKPLVVVKTSKDNSIDSSADNTIDTSESSSSSEELV